MLAEGFLAGAECLALVLLHLQLVEINLLHSETVIKCFQGMSRIFADKDSQPHNPVC